jgi:hypothetical protein
MTLKQQTSITDLSYKIIILTQSIDYQLIIDFNIVFLIYFPPHAFLLNYFYFILMN